MGDAWFSALGANDREATVFTRRHVQLAAVP